MDIHLMQIVVILIIAGLCWYANEALNSVPVLKTVIRVIIVVVSVLLLLQSLGLVDSHSSVSVR